MLYYSLLTDREVNKVADVLLEVDDWMGLASKLHIKPEDQNSIQSNCRAGSGLDVAKCFRRRLVQMYCDLTGLDVEELAEIIVQALEKMHHKKQANEIRKLYPFRGISTVYKFFWNHIILNVYIHT